jgi:hypothetical protein
VTQVDNIFFHSQKVFDFLLSLTGEKVSKEIRSFRYEQCQNCSFFKRTTKSCGTLITGGSVIHNGKETFLCGCLVSEKTKYEDSRCPVENW